MPAGGVNLTRAQGTDPLNSAHERLHRHRQGAGLASATGVRPYLPPLLAGALARGDIGIDFDGTDFGFLESTAFLAAVLVLAVVAFLVDVRGRTSLAGPGGRAARGPIEIAGRVCSAWSSARCCSPARSPTAASGLDRAPVRPALRRARLARASAAWSSACARGSRRDQAALLTAYADGAALLLAAIADLRAAALPPRDPGLRPAAGRRPAARGRRSTRACGSFGSAARSSSSRSSTR